MQTKEFSTEVGGKTLTATFSDLADQANSSVILRYGNTAVLATAVMSANKREGIDFFPLVVDYEEKFYASGQILGSRFVRREGRPSDEAVLSGRVVDRTIRPLFDHRLRNEVQVVITVLALDEDDPDVLAVNAASLALATSDIPWNGPVSAVRVGMHGDKAVLAVNPVYKYRESVETTLDSIICGKDGKIVMIEAGAQQISETAFGAAITKASDEIEKIQEFQKKIVTEIGKAKKALDFTELSQEERGLFTTSIVPKLDTAVFGEAGKEKILGLKKEWLDEHAKAFPEGSKGLAAELYEDAVNDLLHSEAIERSRRPDGRAMDELRPLYGQAGGISDILHGTGVFYRGATHVLSVLTLGGPKDAQLIDGMEIKTEKRFMHHYNFPPFSVGETGRMGGMNRRMIGHGALAEKALAAVIPPKETFPYTIRIVSETMASNGSSSMASVCAGTLALMDAGVPIEAPVGGIAMGLMLDETSGNYKVLTDIQGPEDHHGDMDFKVAGTTTGITAVQMDIKVGSVPIAILEEALIQAKKARLEILDVMKGALASPRPELHPRAPRILIMKVLVDQIGLVIGPGGKTINSIVDATGAEIDIEDDGTIFISGPMEGALKAKAMVEAITREYKIGDRFDGTVIKLAEFGVFVKIAPGKEALVHISEMAGFRVKEVKDIAKEGDVVPVVIIDIDEKNRIKCSIKQADPNFFKNPYSPIAPKIP